jgi:hypothetical protein
MNEAMGIKPVWLFAGFLVFTIAGIPLVAILWETVNQLLSGHLPLERLALSVPALVLFAGLLLLAARMLHKLERSV